MRLRRIVALVTGAILLLSFCACGDNTIEEKQTEQAQVTEEATVTPVEEEVTLTPKAELQEQVEPGEVYPISVVTSERTDSYYKEYVQLADVSYDTIALDGEYAFELGALSSALDDFSANNEKSSLESFEQLKELAEEYYPEDPSTFEYTDYFSRESLMVMRADSRVLSLMSEGSYYVGGAHDDYGRTGYTFDSQTGKQLGIKNVFSDAEQLAKLICEQIKAKYEDIIMFEYEELVTEQIANDSIKWYLDTDGIVVNFNPYELASFADGILQVTIPIKGNESYFNEKYTEVPEEYSYSLGQNHNLMRDFNHDGTYEYLDVYGTSDEYGDIIAIAIDLDEKHYEYDCYAYSFDVRFCHKGGCDYMYVEENGDAGWPTIQIYNISEGNVVLLDTVDGGFETQELYIDDSTSYTGRVLYTPDRQVLYKCADILGTNVITKAFKVAEDGLFEDTGEPYYFVSGFELTLLEDFKFFESDSTDITIIVPAGTVIHPSYTEDERHIVATTDKGETINFTIDYSEWSHTIDGTDITEIFDGLIYAG